MPTSILHTYVKIHSRNDSENPPKYDLDFGFVLNENGLTLNEAYSRAIGVAEYLALKYKRACHNDVEKEAFLWKVAAHWHYFVTRNKGRLMNRHNRDVLVFCLFMGIFIMLMCLVLYVNKNKEFMKFRV